MFTLPFTDVDSPVLWLTGATGQTALALGGPLRNTVSYDGHEPAASPGAMPSVSEPEVAAVIRAAQLRAIEDAELPLDAAVVAPRETRHWAANVVDVLEKMRFYRPYALPKEVEFLARRDEYATAAELKGELGSAINVLIGRPLWIADLA